MHEYEAADVATSGLGDGLASERRQAQCADARRPVVAGRAQHGPGVADSPEPAARGRARADSSAPDMAGVGAPGGSADRRQGEIGTQSRLATMGGSSRDAGPTVHPKKHASGVDTPVSMGGVLDLLERQGFRCALTGRSLTPDTAALDHIVPVRCGGEHVLENTQVLHKEVNRAKGPLTNAEFIDLCREAVGWSHGSTGDGEEARS